MDTRTKDNKFRTHRRKVHAVLQQRDMHSIKLFCIGRVRKKIIRLANCRRFQAYCIGAPRTGTSSCSGIFNDYYRSGHEVDSEDVLKYAFDYQEGKIGLKELERFVIERDKRLHLEMDSSTHNFYLVPFLLRFFPDAKFLIPVREVFSWADSYLDYGINNRIKAGTNVISPQRVRMGHFRYGNLYEKYTPWDSVLKEYGMPCLKAHLLFYNKHYEEIFNLIPENRRIIYEIRKLDQNIPRICGFLGIKPTSLNLRKSRQNTRKKRHHILAGIDPSFLKEKIEQYCSPSIRKFCPELCMNCFISSTCRWKT